MKTIEQKNRMIAEFMGIKVPLTHGDDIENSAVENGYELFYIHELKYHTSWDWLMPVVETIYNTGLNDQNTNEIGDVTHALLDVNINAVYEAVVKFIEMYNDQK